MKTLQPGAVAAAILMLASGCAGTPNFAGLDDDGNGHLTRAETGGHIDNFEQFDADRDGALNREEYRKAFAATQARHELERSLSPPARGGFYGGASGGVSR